MVQSSQAQYLKICFVRSARFEQFKRHHHINNLSSCEFLSSTVLTASANAGDCVEDSTFTVTQLKLNALLKNSACGGASALHIALRVSSGMNIRLRALLWRP